MAGEISKLFVAIGAKTSEFHAGIDGVEKRMNQASKRMKIAGAAMVGAVSAISVFSIKAATDFGKMYSSIAAGTGKSGEALEGLKTTFKDVAGSVALETESVASIITELNTRIGISGKALRGLATNIAEVARMLGVDATAATVQFTNALNRWEVPAGEAPKFLDKLFVASQQTGIGIDNLGRLMSEYGSILKNAGYSEEETIALFGAMYKAGLPITRIMPALNMATRKFAEEGINLREGLEGTITKIGEASTGTEALNIATSTFGAEGAQRLTDAIRAGDLVLDELIGKLYESEGAVSEFSEATKDPAARMAELGNKLKLMAATIGEALLPALERIVEKITPVIEQVSKWVEEHPKLTTAILASVGALGSMMIMGPALASAIKTITAAQWAWNAAMSANPIGLIISAIGLLVVAILGLKGNLGELTSATKTELEAQTSLWETEIAKQQAAATNAHNKRMGELSDWLQAQLAIVDEETAARIQPILEQINLLDDLAKGEERLAEIEVNTAEWTALAKAHATAASVKEQEKAYDDLQKFVEDIGTQGQQDILEWLREQEQAVRKAGQVERGEAQSTYDEQSKLLQDLQDDLSQASTETKTLIGEEGQLLAAWNKLYDKLEEESRTGIFGITAPKWMRGAGGVITPPEAIERQMPAYPTEEANRALELLEEMNQNGITQDQLDELNNVLGRLNLTLEGINAVIKGEAELVIPKLGTGGFVKTGGLAMLHPGETVRPATVDTGASRVSTPVNITIQAGAMMGNEMEARSFARLIHKYLREEVGTRTAGITI